ncbi:hypothetical protein ACVW19_005199 [Streptomyces sp. TE5632]
MTATACSMPSGRRVTEDEIATMLGQPPVLGNGTPTRAPCDGAQDHGETTRTPEPEPRQAASRLPLLRMTATARDITEDLIRDLLCEQHPDLADRPLKLGALGWDNQVWRLGDDLAVRLPWATQSARPRCRAPKPPRPCRHRPRGTAIDLAVLHGIQLSGGWSAHGMGGRDAQPCEVSATSTTSKPSRRIRSLPQAPSGPSA